MTIIGFIPMPTNFFFPLTGNGCIFGHFSAFHYSKCLYPNRAETLIRYLRKEATARTASNNNKSLPLAVCPSGQSVCAEGKASTTFTNLDLFISNSVSTTQIYCSSSPSAEDRRSFLSKVKRNKSTVDGSFRYLEVGSG